MTTVTQRTTDPRVLALGCLSGRAALVSGAGSGIGRAIAIRLAELGANVVGLGRRAERLAETERLIVAGGPAGARTGSFTWRALDVRDRPAAARAVGEITAENGGRLDLLVNNAGGQYVAPATEISDRGMASVLDLNLTAVSAMIAVARPALARARGTVVTISLSSPERGIPGIAHSAAARAAVVALTRRLAAEWGGDPGISLYCLAPGTVLTDGVREELTPEGLARSLAHTPLHVDTLAEEVAEWVAALGAGVGRIASGTAFALDGGAGIHGVGALG